ncbi:copper chaperone PCu(A)C [Streptomyces sp. NPDC058319]|uniref:copper chaperone PCu(A)C n=1 Tax=unclassified Streptomyces TaxID=2593676 RepID=UPI0036E9D9B6
MSSSLRRGALAAAAIAFSIASLAACGAGNNAQTLEVKPDNAATKVGDIEVQNAVIITQPGSQTKGPAVVSMTLFNSGTTPQTLDAIRVDGGGTAQITPAQGSGKLTVPAQGSGKLTVPAQGSVVVGGKGNASAALTNPGPGVKDGNAQKITFTFSKSGDVSLRAFVVPATSYFDKWGPSNIPAAPGAPATGTTGKPNSSKDPKSSESPKSSDSSDSSGKGDKTTGSADGSGEAGTPGGSDS